MLRNKKHPWMSGTNLLSELDASAMVKKEATASLTDASEGIQTRPTLLRTP